MSLDLDALTPYQKLGLNYRLSEFALVLLGDDGEQFEAFGSGFFIAPGFVITAKHVMESYWNTYYQHRQRFPTGKHERDTRFQVFGMQYGNGNIDPGLWIAEDMWTAASSDIALLHVKPYNDRAKKYNYSIIPELTLHSPGIDELIVAFGYPKTEVELIQREPTFQFNYTAPFTRSVGKVLQVHERETPENMYKFPCLETTTRFENGMSGGPVFNSAGKICGVVSGGSGENGVSSFVALLWPAMFIKLQVIDDITGKPKKKFKIHKLLDKTIMCQSGWQEILIKNRKLYHEVRDDDDYLIMKWKNK